MVEIPPRLIVEVLGDSSGLEKALARSSRAATGFDRSIRNTGRGVLSATASFTGLRRAMLSTSAAFIGGAGFVAALKSSVSAASNLAEQTSKTNVVFGKSAEVVKAWSRTTASSIALASDEALQAASDFGGLLRPLGVLPAAAAKTSIDLTKLAADLASFSNTSVPDALAAIRSGLVGEVEPLRRYNVVLSEAAVQQQALKETGKTSTAALTAQEKVLARLTLIFRGTAQSQGDFALTSGGLANQQRILSANIRQLQIVLGTALIPEVSKIVKAMNEWLGKSENQERVQRDVKAAVAGVVGVIKTAVGAWKTFSGAVGGSTNALKLLGVVIAGFKVAKLLNAIGGIGLKSGSAATQVGLLRSRLLLLSKIGVIGIGLELVFNRKGADKAISGFLRDHGLGAFTGKEIKTVPQLLKAATKSGLEGNAARDALRNPEAQSAVKKYLAALASHAVGDLVKALPKAKTLSAAAGVTVPETVSGLGKRGVSNLTTKARNALDLSAAGLTASTVDDLKALREQRELLEKAIATETERLKTAGSAKQAQKFADNLEKLQDQDAAAISQIASLAKKQPKGITVDQRNTFFDNSIGRLLDRAQDGVPKEQLAKLASISALITERIAATKDITRKLNLEDKLLDVGRQIKGVRDQLAQGFLDALQFGLTKAQATLVLRDDLAALSALQAGIEARIKAVGHTIDLDQQLLDVVGQIKQAHTDVGRNLLDALSFRLDKATATKSQQDDLAALDALQKGVLAQIKIEGRTLELEQQLFDIGQKRVAANRQIAKNRADARNARQFKALGLTATGDDLVTGVAGLRRSLGSITGAITGTFLDTTKTQSILSHVRKVLSGGLGAVGRDVRDKVRSILADLDQQLKDHGPATKFHKANVRSILRTAGLDPSQVKALAGSISQIGAGGMVHGTGVGAFGRPLAAASGPDLVVHTHISLDGREIAVNTTKHQQVKQRRNPIQKRGPFAGKPLI